MCNETDCISIILGTLSFNTLVTSIPSKTFILFWIYYSQIYFGDSTEIGKQTKQNSSSTGSRKKNAFCDWNKRGNETKVRQPEYEIYLFFFLYNSHIAYRTGKNNLMSLVYGSKYISYWEISAQCLFNSRFRLLRIKTMELPVYIPARAHFVTGQSPFQKKNTSKDSLILRISQTQNPFFRSFHL